ncbi:hypothetical protein [Micromonospora sp. CB01531]|uniref:hypothetical protein n=1 Tax=Micromonospora sp. CB01531 TaxID=1718947 RepID=UPI00093960D5|nr:hypothetical protein [Micromonospora sp. CB01531]OKI46066.1 hypothetical protein A6A27_37460 [Micromonospora sp. CB01531]
MGVNAILKKAAIGVAAAATLTAGTVVATAGPAAAAMGQGRVQLCSQGNYWSYLEYTGTYLSSYRVAPGSCGKWDIPAGTYQIEVRGMFNTSSSTFWMGSFAASASSNPGWKVYTRGTTANGGQDAWWYATQS